jgi:hypothetical protein
MPGGALGIDRRPLIPPKEQEIEGAEQSQLQYEHGRDIAPEAGCRHDH